MQIASWILIKGDNIYFNTKYDIIYIDKLWKNSMILKDIVHDL